MNKSCGNSIKGDDAGKLQQMSDEMKRHIAQLKAELSNADMTQHDSGQLEKQVRNKAVAAVLRKKMEASKQRDGISSQQSGNISTDGSYGLLFKKDVIEPLNDAVSDDNVHSTEFTFLDDGRRRNSDVYSDVTMREKVKRSTEEKSSKERSFSPINVKSDTSSLTKKLKTSSRDMEDLSFVDPAQDDVTSVHSSEKLSTLQKDEELFFTPAQSPPKQNEETSSAAVSSPVAAPRHSKSASRGSDTSSKRKTSKHRHRDSVSSTDTLNSTPRSTEESIPVKYLQMTNTSPKLIKKAQSASRIKSKSSSVPSSARGSKSDTALVCKEPIDDEEREKYNLLEAQLFKLQLQCEQLAEENIRMKREERSKASEKIANLKKSNGELANIARRLEEKAKALQEQNLKKSQDLTAISRELQQQKRAHQRQRARWESEQSRTLTERNDEISNSKGQVEDLKRALRQLRREKLAQLTNKDSGDELNAFRQTHKEMLHLQKLAAAASSKVVVRSLSTPVTARQKILEESNRNLRRQVTAAEANLQQSEAKLHATIQRRDASNSLKDENESLKREVEALKNSAATLQSALQESKVETSDVSVQLTELKHVHIQLQDDYATVHEQLSVAISERDKAVRKCVQDNENIKQMDALITELQSKADVNNFSHEEQEKIEKKHEEEMSRVAGSHKKVVAEYQDALLALQTKVSQLEQQCQEQDAANKSMKEQLSRLVQWSKNNPTLQNGEKISNNSDKAPDNTNNNNASGLSRVVDNQPTLTNTSSPFKNINENRRSTTSNSSKEKSGVKSNPIQSPCVEDIESDGTEVEDFEEEDHPLGGAMAPVNGAPDSSPSVLKLYIAKYTYNPDEGPNSNPEFELPLVAGDYLYISGGMDEDGFYEGELMDGRRGLVPSNFIEPLHDPSSSNNSPSPHGGPNFITKKSPHRRPVAGPVNSRRLRRSFDSDLNHSFGSGTTSSLSTGSHEPRHVAPPSGESRPASVLPFPRNLRIDKQLSHTLIIGWIPPQLDEGEQVEEYHILVDGRLATVVDGNKNKAVVENIFHDKQRYAISACCVTKRGRSDPLHCVVGHGGGQKGDPRISHVKTEHITTESVRVSWKPTNSNFANTISIGAVGEDLVDAKKLPHYQRQILVSSPMYRHTINGLKPRTMYEYVVKTRSAKLETEVSSSPARFVTPSVGPPEAPLGVEVEEDLSSGSLTVSWVPVTLTERGLSNGVVVSGYVIHVNDISLASVEPSTCDECVVSFGMLASRVRRIINSDVSCRDPSFGFSHGLPSISITARTAADGGQMSDSSAPFTLHKSLVIRLMQAAPDKDDSGDDKLMRSGSPRSLTRSQLDTSGGDQVGSPGNALLDHIRYNQQRRHDSSLAVPSIEITLETSSEEEVEHIPMVVHRPSRHILPSTNTPGASPRLNRTMDDAVAHVKRQEQGIKSRSWGYSGHHAPPDPSRGRRHKTSTPPAGGHRRVHSDEESGTSASSGGHTSTSTSGSAGNKRRSASQKQLKHHSWTRVTPGDQHNEVVFLPGGSSAANTKSRSVEYSRPQSSHSDVHPGEGRHSAVARQHRPSHTASSQSERGSTSEFESVDYSRVSLFVALYDYHPTTMSPNKDICDDELSFTEGQLLKVFGDKDNDGFYLGEDQRGKRGYVPSNMISYVEVDDFTMLEDLFEQGHLPPESPRIHSNTSGGISQMESSFIEDSHALMGDDKPKQPLLYRALYDYDPKEASPNIDAEVELSFVRGELINIYGEVDEDGFFRGEINGTFGLVPSNFVEQVNDDQVQTDDDHRVRKVSATTMTEASVIRAAKKANKSPDPNSVTSTSSNASSNKADGAKKKGIFSKGKKLFKKLGGNEPRKR